MNDNGVNIEAHMFKQTHKVLLLSIVVSTLVFGACSKKEVRTGDNSLMIIELTGQSIVVKADKEIPAVVGMLVGGDDVIRIVTGTLDAQSRVGAVMRLRAGSTMSVKHLTGGRDTEVNLKSGSLTGRLDKARAGDNLSVVSPTAIAGVRGTTFLVEADASSSSVRVIDGRVAVVPTPDQSSKNAAETVLSPGENGSVAQGKSVKVAASPVTEKELLYKATVVSVSSDVFDRVAAGGSASEISSTLSTRRAEELNKALQGLGYGGKTPSLALSTEKELRQFYPELDSVILKSGEKLTGAVIAADEKGIVMHTVRGIVRIERSEIASSQIHSR
ncbi:MAG: FecR domain-containing protein [Spirochaetia bacterium]|nr:FecR domain-containing protein [Spirochaetia bacterium]